MRGTVKSGAEMNSRLPIGAEVWAVIESLTDRWFSGESFPEPYKGGKE